MKNTVLLISLNLIFLIGYSQTQIGAHGNKWHFGKFCALDFQSGFPVAVAGSPLQADEGCATISDNVGNLLFFTNGVDIWDATNTVMPNGAGVNGKLLGNNGGTATDVQAPMIVREPGSTTRYYVFTIDDSDNFFYSVVDMTLSANGDVVPALKNQFLANNIGEGITATRHANGVDWWVVTHSNTGNAIHVGLLTASGVSGATTTNIGLSGFRNHMKISYDGSLLGHSVSGVGTQIFDFNNSTGTISNQRTLFTSGRNYLGIEFSPNSQYLYTTEDQNVIQYDVTAVPISSSRTIKGTITGGIPLSLGTLQLAPDGKIYIAKLGLFPYNDLAAINNPNSAAATYNNSAVVHGAISFLGLPQYYELIDLLVLPIELASFKAYKNESTTQLEWTTSSEINNDYFVVERSTDALSFIQVIEVQGAGNSNQALHYQAQDLQPENGYNYYRLKQVDFNGEYSYSDIETVFYEEEIKPTFGPNPVVNQGYLKFNLLHDTQITYQIIDMTGRMVYSTSQSLFHGNQRLKIDCASLATGHYLINIETENQKIKPIQFIKK